MDTDRNLLFGIIAMQAGLIDASEFVETSTIWASRKDISLADLLVERNLMNATDAVHINYLLERRLEKTEGDVGASLASIPQAIRQSLSQIGDPEIEQSLSIGIPSDVNFDETQILATTKPEVIEPSQRYEQRELHATGGIGRVWWAWDKTLNRRVALKELKPESADNEVLRARFRREAMITGQLAHPGIIPVYDLVSRDDLSTSFYTTRFVSGQTLAEAAREFHASRLEGEADSGQLIPLLNAFVTVCNTVAYAHSKGVIHRDLKGENVILGDFGETVVVDWGFAKRAGDEDLADEEAALDNSSEVSDSDLTIHGQAIGTPAYMAPEQAAGELDSIDHRTDVYGLGSILYQVLTGERPFSGSSVQEVLHKVQYEAPASPSEVWPDVPPSLETTCLRALAKNPEDRFESAAKLGHEVEQWQENQRREAEEALRISQALYQSLVDTLPLCIWRKDVNNRFTFANDRLCQELKCDAQSIIGNNDFDFYPRELAEKYWHDDSEVLRTGGTFEATEEHAEPSGENYVVHVVKTPVRDARGKIIGTQGVYWDVSELKRAEWALRESEALYRSLVDILPLILVRKDLQSRFTFVNKRFCEAVGKPLEEIVGKTDADFFPKELADEYLRHDHHVFATRQPLETEEKFIERGEPRDIQVIKTPTFDPSGELNGLQIIVWDVTEQKRLEEALAWERDLLHALMDNVPDRIYFKDTSSRFIRVNRRLADFMGFSDINDALGKTDADVFTSEHAIPAREDELEVMRTGRPIVAKEEKEMWPDGRVTWVSTTKVPFRNKQGEIIGTLGISREIPEPTQK